MKKTVVMISGANRGIGLSIAKQLSNEPNVYLSLGMRSPKDFDISKYFENKERISLNFYNAKVPESAQTWVNDTVKNFGGIDVLINNAAIVLSCGIQNYSENTLDEMWNVNTKAPINLTHLSWEYLKSSGRGRLVNIVSISGKITRHDEFGYNLTKHAMLAFTHSMRQAGWQYGIRALAVCPGWVNTDLARNSSLCSLSPEAMTQPEDIAKLIDTIIQLPNTASVADLTVNAECGVFF